jgi:hypothetical protein
LLPDAIRELERSISDARDAPEAANAARIRLAQLCLASQNANFDRTMLLCDEVAKDYRENKASVAQMAQSIFFRAQVLTLRKAYPEAKQCLGAIATLAAVDRELVCDSLLAKGECCRHELKNVELSDNDLRLSLHAESLYHYQKALEVAEAAGVEEYKRDKARLLAATEMRHLGMRDRAIAWLRAGIEDPSQIDSADKMLTAGLASIMSKEEREAWQLYLLTPSETPDPTAKIVERELGSPPPLPSKPAPDKVSERLLWLAEFYKDQKRWTDAVLIYERVAGLAQTAPDFASFSVSLIECLAALRDNARKNGREDEASGHESRIHSVADQGSSAWIEIIKSTPESEALIAIESAINCYQRAGLTADALRVAHAIHSTTDSQREPAKAAWAAYILATRYKASGNVREARRISEDAYQRFKDNPRADVQLACRRNLRYALFCTAVGKEYNACLALLDELEARWPNEERATIETFRRRCAAYLAR